jgi:hypothetical protein
VELQDVLAAGGLVQAVDILVTTARSLPAFSRAASLLWVILGMHAPDMSLSR